MNSTQLHIANMSRKMVIPFLQLILLKTRKPFCIYLVYVCIEQFITYVLVNKSNLVKVKFVQTCDAGVKKVNTLRKLKIC